ncbi:unnamed protein product [Caenorhabditis angaria]|uniref:ShKT domain-containing protein n=1 Tax=Caenorhabditis angaria TaxID=860376 RepID=A0A9P1IFA3_9PELO|nr:unnamed protein product [Caenorhabditis angaria]
MRFFALFLVFGLVAADDSSTVVTTVATTTVGTTGTTGTGGTTATTTAGTTGTTSATCQDAPGENCSLYVSVCSDPRYYPLLKGKCDKTCGYCGSVTTTTPSSTPCVDNSSNCVNWVKNGFCTNTFYNCTQRKQYCAKSCNLCNTSC